MRVKLTEEEKRARRAARAKMPENMEKRRKQAIDYYHKNKKEILPKKALYKKDYYIKNSEFLKAKSSCYYNKNKDFVLSKQKERYQLNRDRAIAHRRYMRLKNKENINKAKRDHYQGNRDSIIARNKSKRLSVREKAFFDKYGARDKKTHNEIRKLSITLRNRISGTIKRDGGEKAFKSIVLLGCSIAHARQHLESQFLPGMTWENHSPDGWHIDHKKPCASFDLTDPEQQKACFHYTNLQPLWATDNLSKGKKIDWQPQRQSAQP